MRWYRGLDQREFPPNITTRREATINWKHTGWCKLGKAVSHKHTMHGHHPHPTVGQNVLSKGMLSYTHTHAHIDIAEWRAFLFWSDIFVLNAQRFGRNGWIGWIAIEPESLMLAQRMCVPFCRTRVYASVACVLCVPSSLLNETTVCSVRYGACLPSCVHVWLSACGVCVCVCRFRYSLCTSTILIRI